MSNLSLGMSRKQKQKQRQKYAKREKNERYERNKKQRMNNGHKGHLLQPENKRRAPEDTVVTTAMMMLCVQTITHRSFDDFCNLINSINLPVELKEILDGLSKPFHPLRELFTTGIIDDSILAKFGLDYIRWIFIYIRLIPEIYQQLPNPFYEYITGTMDQVNLAAPQHAWWIEERFNEHYPREMKAIREMKYANVHL